ncbi:MAG TPA: ABC transporter permease [Pseudomonadales bacterium]
MKLASPVSRARRLTAVCLLLLVAALLALPGADLQVYPVDPWQELARIGLGLLQPAWHDGGSLLEALLHTIAFALLAVALAAPLGLLLAMQFHRRLLRLLCAAVRSVHELFWALIFMQVFGLGPLTGLLAILLPFTGVFAKVFAEIIDQQQPLPGSLPAATGRLAGYAYYRIPLAWPALASYTRYRFECALRSSAILGFIGLPTLGFHLETAFRQGQYAEAGALLWLFLLLIAGMRFWLRPRLLPLYLPAAVFCLPEAIGFSSGGSLWRFVSQDIWPQPLRDGNWPALLDWLRMMASEQVWPALLQTLLLTQIAVALTGVLALACYPLASRALAGPWLRWPGRFLLLALRSTPEMVLAWVLLLLFGPSGLPAVLALALHNGGLIAFLLANASDAEQRSRLARPDDPTGLKRFAYVETPRRLPAMLALLFYRWEVILRESAILGILGVATLGFYIDSAFEEIRYDRALLLIAVSALLNMLIDSLSRRLRRLAGEPGQLSATPAAR